jgi:acyl-CoA-dependent ceramide synthase
LNYLDHPLVGPYFALFIFMWIYLRHYLNLQILWSEFNEFKTVGPYELDWANGQFKCPLSHYISTALLASLQGLNIFWLYYIMRIAYRFVFLNIVEDDRSDNDENELAEEQRLDALARQGIDKLSGPKVLLNGAPVNGNGKATGTETRVNGTTNRREPAREA